MDGRWSSVPSQIPAMEWLISKGNRVGRKRASGRTYWRSWEEEGQPEEIRRREAGAAAARWRGELCCSVGEAQRSGGTAPRGPGGAIYRERKGGEGRTAEHHGGAEVAVPAAALGALEVRGGATEAG
jgi:hypothetical protein